MRCWARGEGGAFSRCILLGTVILSKCAEVGPNAFSGSHMESVVIPKGADPQMMTKLAHALRFTYSFSGDLEKDWPQEYADIYCGKSEDSKSWNRITNGSGNTFAGSLLPDLVLPDKLELMGNCAFGASCIRSLTFPHGLRMENYRQFKDPYVMELRVPAEYGEMLSRETDQWGWGWSTEVEFREQSERPHKFLCI